MIINDYAGGARGAKMAVPVDKVLNFNIQERRHIPVEFQTGQHAWKSGKSRGPQNKLTLLDELGKANPDDPL